METHGNAKKRLETLKKRLETRGNAKKRLETHGNAWKR